MIQTWTIQNFKSVSDKTTLSMKPLTIFAGANSSGKSTLIQSILLVAQTLQTTVGSRSVVLNGHILKLGSFDDIVFNHQSDQTVLIGFGLTPIIEPPPVIPGGTEKMGHFFSADPESTVARSEMSASQF
ncbi:AAA family ATPase [Desulfobacterales bacterium HSG2]|nr:AAA family ATPase [Desulfobacterales bacterium HSG2]